MSNTIQFGLSSEQCRLLVDTLKDTNFNDRVSLIEQSLYESDRDTIIENICVRDQLIRMFKVGIRIEKQKPSCTCIVTGKQIGRAHV